MFPEFSGNMFSVCVCDLSTPIFIFVVTKCSASLQDFPPRKFGESHDFFSGLNTSPSSGSPASL